MKEMNQLLSQALAENHLDLSSKVQAQLISYLELLISWNRVFNLTTITTPREMVYLHIIDSLSVAPYLKGERFLDVGSGAGLPGIPLAIINSNQKWVLLDKNIKKIRFLTQVIAELKLPHVEVVHSRALDFQSDFCFDSILSRALGTIRMFIEETAHLLCPGGMLIAMKGKYPTKELQGLATHYQVRIMPIKIIGMQIERHAVLLNRKNDLWEKSLR